MNFVKNDRLAGKLPEKENGVMLKPGQITSSFQIEVNRRASQLTLHNLGKCCFTYLQGVKQGNGRKKREPLL